MRIAHVRGGAPILGAIWGAILLAAGPAAGAQQATIPPAAAQTPAPPAAGQAPGQASAAPAAQDNHITIEAVVTDKKGHVIHGLEAANFTLLDNKAPQQILSFRARTPETAHQDPVHVFIILDEINSDYTLVAREREELSQFLKQAGGELASPTAIGVMADTGAKLADGFTQDGNQLNEAFSKQGSELRVVGRSTGFWGAADRLQMSLNQFGQIAGQVAKLPGRKLVLFLSPGWPMLPASGTQSDMRQRAWVFNFVTQFSNGLRQDNIAVYTLDPHELGRTDPFYYESYLKGVSQMKDAEYPHLALQVLSEHSGGRVLSGRDVMGELTAAMQDANASYEMTFASAAGDHPNEYHNLQLKVNQANAQVHTTSGYYLHVQPVSAK